MDYGKLTDHNSRTVDFRNVILIMTSNVGVQHYHTVDLIEKIKR